MKTKHILTALALPAFLAACTNEDFAGDTPNTGNLSGREMIEKLVIAPSYGEADTRMGTSAGASGFSYYWKNTDRIGAALVENNGKNTPDTDSKIYSNYPFAPTGNIDWESKPGNVSFSTPTAVMTGAYMFYHQYKGDFTTMGAKMAHSLEPVQSVKANDESEAADRNFFISPLLNLKKGIAYTEGEAKNVYPIKMVPVYGMVRITIDSDLKPEYYNGKNSLKVYKVGFEAKSGNEFVMGGNIKTSGIADAAKLGVYTDIDEEIEEDGVIQTHRDDRAFTSDELDKAMNIAKEEMMEQKTADFFINDTERETSNNIFYQLDEAYEFTSKDDKLVVWAIIPADDYKQANIKLKVYTNEGVATFEDLGGADKVLSVNHKNAATMSRTLVIKDADSNVKPGQEFSIYNNQDWEDAIDYVRKNTEEFVSLKYATFNLEDDIEIETVPADMTAIKVSGKKKLILAEDMSIDPDQVILDKTNTPTVVVKKGVTLTVDKNFVTDGSKGVEGVNYTGKLDLVVDGGGKVVLNQDIKLNLASLSNKGTMEVNGQAIMTSGSTGKNDGFGEITIGSRGAVNATSATSFTNEKNAIITVKKKDTEIDGYYGGKLTRITNNGLVNNWGEVESITNSGVLFTYEDAYCGVTSNKNGELYIGDPDKFVNQGNLNATTIEGKIISCLTSQLAHDNYLAAKGSGAYVAAKNLDNVIALWGCTVEYTSENNTDNTETWLCDGATVKGTKSTKVVMGVKNGNNSIAQNASIVLTKLTVNENAEMTISEKAVVEIAEGNTLTVNGKLTNRGDLKVTMNKGTALGAEIGEKGTFAQTATATTGKSSSESGVAQVAVKNKGRMDISKGEFYGTVNTLGNIRLEGSPTAAFWMGETLTLTAAKKAAELGAEKITVNLTGDWNLETGGAFDYSKIDLTVKSSKDVTIKGITTAGMKVKTLTLAGGKQITFEKSQGSSAVIVETGKLTVESGTTLKFGTKAGQIKITNTNKNNVVGVSAANANIKNSNNGTWGGKDWNK